MQSESRLFSEEQQRQLEWMQSQAPHLYGAPAGTTEARNSPQKLSQEELRQEADRLHIQWQLEKEKAEMLSYMQSLHEENMKLKVQLAKDRDHKYATPDSNPLQDQPGSKVTEPPAGDKKDGVRSCLRTYGMPSRARSTTPPEKPDSRPAEQRQDGGGAGYPQQDQTINVVLKLMEGMQAMQEQLMKQSAGGSKAKGSDDHEEEVIRTGIQLHALPEWNMESAPVDFQDWLLLISPQMGDWWNEAVQTAKDWYDSHQSMKPLEKLKHEIQPTAFLQQRRWARLEKRASNLLLLALPESQKEDIISTKSLTVLNILARLMQNYQPGGAHEKAAVIAALENPFKAGTVAEVITGLRKWIRWKKRAADINVALPDPTILLKGLDKLVTKVLGAHPTPQFRVNLTRSDLMVDSMPTLSGIDQYAECLLAEFDQMSYSRRREKAWTGPAGHPKIKKLEEGVQVKEEPEQSRYLPKDCRCASTTIRRMATERGRHVASSARPQTQRRGVGCAEVPSTSQANAQPKVKRREPHRECKGQRWKDVRRTTSRATRGQYVHLRT